MLNQPDKKHLFSVYINNLYNSLNKKKFILKNKELWVRLVKVLRLEEEEIVFFDNKINVKCCITRETFASKDTVFADVIIVSDNIAIKPEITLLCPLLKKEAFEKVLYFAAELGVSKIIPVITAKVHRNWFSEKDIIRFQKIIISAAEQSKNYVIPDLRPSIEFKYLVELEGLNKIVFCEQGRCVSEFITKKEIHDSVMVTLGPEGDFTDLEYKSLTGWDFVSLTPTVLKAEHAVAVGIGLLRSFYKKE